MALSVDQQLAHLSELHDRGALSDDEFARAKATTIEAATPEPPERSAVVLTSWSDACSRFRLPWMVLASLVLGMTVVGIGSGLEWEAVQTPAAPFVCPGGELHTGFEVSYSVNRKGVDPAAGCERDGVTRPVAAWVMFGLLSLLWAVPFLLVFLLARVLGRWRQQVSCR